MAKKPIPNQVLYRDSDTGRIVERDYAIQHPKTTERERVHNPQLPPVPAPKQSR
jgi:hypothetical protein